MRRTLLLAIAALLALVLVAFAVAQGWMAGVDGALLQAAAPIGDRWMAPITTLGDTVVRFAIAAVTAGALWLARDRAGAGFVIGAVVGGAAFNALLKSLFARPRPDLLPHLDVVTSLSFPSGHSAGAAVLGGVLAVAAIRHGAARGAAWALAALFALLVGVSRVALAVHWPSDVLAGWASGALWVALCAALLDSADRRHHVFANRTGA